MTKSAIFPQSVKELSPTAELKEHVDESVVLKGGFQFIYERVPELVKDLFLQSDVVHLLKIDYVGFRDLLQG